MHHPFLLVLDALLEGVDEGDEALVVRVDVADVDLEAVHPLDIGQHGGSPELFPDDCSRISYSIPARGWKGKEGKFSDSIKFWPASFD